ncbi:hypothetical protein C7B61_13145 [filamentous cyanobacterium CCP1]|nr:hypothetical protein C7B61_13145 [filamentous cyanobacterium CCP1]
MLTAYEFLARSLKWFAEGDEGIDPIAGVSCCYEVDAGYDRTLRYFEFFRVPWREYCSDLD